MQCMNHVALDCCGKGVKIAFTIISGRKKCVNHGGDTVYGDGGLCAPGTYCTKFVCGNGKPP